MYNYHLFLDGKSVLSILAFPKLWSAEPLGVRTYTGGGPRT